MDTIINIITSLALTDLFLKIKDFITTTYDYTYILLLKYFIFIADNYIVYFWITVPLLLLLYIWYNSIMYKKSSILWYIGLLIVLPFSIIIYILKFTNAFFDKYLYYRWFNVDYLQDVPRKKRDYILEKTIRSKITQWTRIKINE